MAIYGENKYVIENNVNICDLKLQSLFLLYQPLIGANAISLYLTFNKGIFFTNYTDLSIYTNLNIELIEHSLIMLESYNLIKTYKNNRDEYIHVLLNPLFPRQFLSHYVFGLQLRKTILNHNFNLLLDKYMTSTIDKTGYFDVSEKKNFNFDENFSEDLELIIKQNKEEIDLPKQFNYQLFLKDTSNLLFPASLRSKENLNLIGELALLYGISEERMQTLVYRSIDYKNMVFESDKLIERVRREKINIDKDINKYQLPPVAFLQNLQNGGAVSVYNKEILEYLVSDMLLNKPVVNRLIEYIMETNNNILVKNHILSIATTWKSFDIKTVEQANQLIEKISRKTTEKDQVLSKRSGKEVSDVEYSEKEQEELALRIKKFGEKYGKN